MSEDTQDKKLVPLNTIVEKRQLDALRALSKRTKVPQSRLLRDMLDVCLERGKALPDFGFATKSAA